MLCGVAVGFVQYLLITGFSYLSIILQLSVPLSSALLIGSHALILYVAGWNIFYKVQSFAVLFLRVITSIGSYIFVWSVCVHFEIIASLEKWLGIGSGGQNTQGMIELSFCVWLLLAGIIMIVVKCFALRQNDQ